MMSAGSDLRGWIERDLAELSHILESVGQNAGAALGERILASERVFVMGAGRSGLMLRAFAMRLMHIGLTAHVVGDATTPAIGPGDLLIVASASGSTGTALSATRAARKAQARIAALTVSAASPISRSADLLVRFPGAGTKAGTSAADGLPLGTVFEQALLVFLDALTAMLASRRGVTEEEMRARHTNLE